MQPAMNTAMKEAGIAVPENKRIWLWLRDHAPTKYSAAQIAAALNVPMSNVSTLCGNMVARGMLESAEIDTLVRAGRGHTYRPVNHYTVSPKLRGEYELLPLPAKIRQVDPTPAAAPPAATPYMDALPEVKKVFTPEAIVQNLSLAQCKELYIYLRDIFKE